MAPGASQPIRHTKICTCICLPLPLTKTPTTTTGLKARVPAVSPEQDLSCVALTLPSLILASLPKTTMPNPSHVHRPLKMKLMSKRKQTLRCRGKTASSSTVNILQAQMPSQRCSESVNVCINKLTSMTRQPIRDTCIATTASTFKYLILTLSTSHAATNPPLRRPARVDSQSFLKLPPPKALHRQSLIAIWLCTLIAAKAVAKRRPTQTSQRKRELEVETRLTLA